jgi:predicted PurR-regulated permease PerM
MHEPAADAAAPEAHPGDDVATDQATEAVATSVTSVPMLVPRWLVNLAELGWRVLAIAALVVVLWFVGTTLWTVTASIAVAIIVSAVLAPFVLRLRDQGRSRTAAAGIVWAVSLLVVTGVLLLLALALLPHIAELARSIDGGISELRAQLADLQVPAWVGALGTEAGASSPRPPAR